MEWQPISTAQRDGTRVLVLTEDGMTVCADWGAMKGAALGWRTFQDDTGVWWYVSGVTHWIPIPELPIE